MINNFMKNAILLLTVSAFMTIGCDWLDRTPVVNECDKCGSCSAGCCLSGKCDNKGCDCSCEK